MYLSKKQKVCAIVSISVGTSVIITLTTVLAVTLTPRTTEFRNSFMSECIWFKNRSVCLQLLSAFEQAYVGRCKCDVPVEAYDPLIAAAPFNHDSSRCSGAKRGMTDDFKRGKFMYSLDNTLFGNVTKGYGTWCGKKGSKETFTYYCPGWSGCNNNPVRSYWSRVSAAFAEYAQGEVTALLSRSSEIPFSPEGFFIKFQVPALQPDRVQRLNVILVAETHLESTCASLGELRRQLDARIECVCKEVLEYYSPDDSYILEKPCGY